jgi:hypothetical protein
VDDSADGPVSPGTVRRPPGIVRSMADDLRHTISV